MPTSRQQPEFNILLGNDTTIDADGWALIAPYGEHAKTRVARIKGVLTDQKFLQVLDNAAADALLDNENGLFRRIKRAIIGIPVYKAHPDLRDHAPETLANSGRKEQIGVIDQVRKGALGIMAHFILSPDGAAAVENEGCKYPSALWMCQIVGERGDAMLARPYKLLSVGLTAHPNISGVESLANARGAEIADQKEPDMKLLAGYLLAQGVALENSEAPTETQVLDAIRKLLNDKAGVVVALGNEKSTLAGQVTTLENERASLAAKSAALENEKKELTTKVAALENERKTERNARAAAVVDLAITKGKLNISERESKITALANSSDFDADAKKILGSAYKVKTIAGLSEQQQTAAEKQAGGQTTAEKRALANEGTDGADPRDEYCTAIATEMKATGGTDPIAAHKAVLKKYPTLAEKLKAREAAPGK